MIELLQMQISPKGNCWTPRTHRLGQKFSLKLATKSAKTLKMICRKRHDSLRQAIEVAEFHRNQIRKASYTLTQTTHDSTYIVFNVWFSTETDFRSEAFYVRL